MDRLTIVHVSTQRGWHGGEEQARLLIRGLAMRGHRCIVFARADGVFAKRIKNEGCEVYPVTGSGRGFGAMWQQRARLRKLNPDVLHFHDAHALSGAGLAARHLPIPARVVARRVDFSIHSTWRYRKLADRVIAVSHAVAEVCRTSGLDSTTIRVVHDGVDPQRVRSGNRQRGRQSLGVTESVALIMCVATLTDHKGHTFLLRALPAVLARHPNARLMLAGDGELRQSLEAEARSIGIASAVTFLGYRSDVPDLLKAADLFVLPSHLEGLCSTLIDAMFARVPIVATTAGGIPEVLGSTSTNDPSVARLVPPRDPHALAAVIIDSLNNSAGRQSDVDRAEIRAQRSFPADQMVEKTLAVYEDVLQGSRYYLASNGQRRAA